MNKETEVSVMTQPPSPFLINPSQMPLQIHLAAITDCQHLTRLYLGLTMARQASHLLAHADLLIT
jgi:hypothetical protein